MIPPLKTLIGKDLYAHIFIKYLYLIVTLINLSIADIYIITIMTQSANFSTTRSLYFPRQSLKRFTFCIKLSD